MNAKNLVIPDLFHHLRNVPEKDPKFVAFVNAIKVILETHANAITTKSSISTQPFARKTKTARFVQTMAFVNVVLAYATNQCMGNIANAIIILVSDKKNCCVPEKIMADAIVVNVNVFRDGKEMIADV